MSHNVNWPVGPAETLAAEENHVYYYYYYYGLRMLSSEDWKYVSMLRSWKIKLSTVRRHVLDITLGN